MTILPYDDVNYEKIQEWYWQVYRFKNAAKNSQNFSMYIVERLARLMEKSLFR